MSKTYLVTIESRLRAMIEIEADNDMEAGDKALKMAPELEYEPNETLIIDTISIE